MGFNSEFKVLTSLLEGSASLTRLLISCGERAYVSMELVIDGRGLDLSS